MLYSKYGFFSFFNLGLKIKNIDNICYVLMTNWKQFENAMNIPTRLVIRYLIAVKKTQCLRTWLDKCIDVLFYNKINTKNSIILGFFYDKSVSHILYTVLETGLDFLTSFAKIILNWFVTTADIFMRWNSDNWH